MSRPAIAQAFMSNVRDHDTRRIDTAVRRRLVLVESRVLPAQVVPEAARRCVDVEEARGRVTRVAERMDDAARDEHERPRRHPERPALERDLELALENEERVGVVVVDVRARTELARPVLELAQRQLFGVREQRHSAAGTVGDRLAGRIWPRDGLPGRRDARCHRGRA